MWGDISSITKKLITVEMQLLKSILNVKKGTTNEIVYYELRRPDIMSKIKDKQYSFFNKVLNLSENDAILVKIIDLCRRSRIMNYYHSLTGTCCTEFLLNIEEKMRTNNRSMIIYYHNLIYQEKSCIYQTFINDYYRKVITRWRLSSHKLRIETGRYARPYIDRERRVCILCNIVEDEEHVIFVCPLYSAVRLKHRQVLSVNNTIKSILNPTREFIINIACLLHDIESSRNDMNL